MARGAVPTVLESSGAATVGSSRRMQQLQHYQSAPVGLSRRDGIDGTTVTAREQHDQQHVAARYHYRRHASREC
jgi:hypothetical protein